MGIVFFEDFSQDTIGSIADRYAGDGSTRYVLGEDIGGWPLIRPSASAAYWKALPLNISQRTEVYLELEDNGYPGSVNSSTGFYGISIYSNNNSKLFLQAGTATGAGSPWWEIPDLPISSVKDIAKLYIDVNFSARTVTCLINGAICLNRAAMPEDWYGWIAAYARYAVYLPTPGNPRIANTIKKIVIATDNPEGQMLDIDNLQFVKRTLVYADSTNMGFTDVGYVEDVDKADPTVSEPGVYTETDGMVQYAAASPANRLGSKVYLAGWSENPNKSLILGDRNSPLARTVGPNEEFLYDGETLEVSVASPLAFTAELVVNNTEAPLSPRFTNAENIVIDWGDGNTEHVGSASRADHNYLVPGTYTLKITGRCSSLTVASEHLTEVQSWGDLRFEGVHFYKSAVGVDDPAIASPNLVVVPDYLPPEVRDLRNCFREASSFNQSITNGKWDFSRIEQAAYFLFGASSYNQPVDIEIPALNLSFLLAGTAIDTQVKIKLTGVGSISLYYLFSQSPNLTELPEITGNTDQVVDVQGMLDSCDSFNSPVNDFLNSLPNVTSVQQFLYRCSSFDQPVDLVLPEATNINYLLGSCSSLNKPISIVAPKALYAHHLIYNCNVLNSPVYLSIPLVSFSAGYSAYLVGNCPVFNQDCSNWCVSSLTSPPPNFGINCPAWVLPKPVWGTCPVVE